MAAGPRLLLNRRHDEAIDVLCEGLPVFSAHIAERDGRIALLVEERRLAEDWPVPVQVRTSNAARCRMIIILLEAIGLLLVAAIAVHSAVLHIRLGRFHRALAEVGKVLGPLDSSVGRMTAISAGFTQRLQADLETVEGRLAAARKAGLELSAAKRAAEDAAGQLDHLLRQHRRLEFARPAPLPRELVEPKGFAERAGLDPVPPAGESR